MPWSLPTSKPSKSHIWLVTGISIVAGLCALAPAWLDANSPDICVWARGKTTDDVGVRAREILKLAPRTSDKDLARIVEARSLGLPDNASPKQILEAQEQSELETLALRRGWPLGLDLDTLRSKQRDYLTAQKCKGFGLKTDASPKMLQEAQKSYDKTEDKIQEQYYRDLAKVRPEAGGEQTKLFQNMQDNWREHTRPIAARKLDLPENSSWEQINEAHSEQTRRDLCRQYGLPDTAKYSEINHAERLQNHKDRVLMMCKILQITAPPDGVVSDEAYDQMRDQLRVVAHALGYPSRTGQLKNIASEEHHLTVQTLLNTVSRAD